MAVIVSFIPSAVLSGFEPDNGLNGFLPISVSHIKELEEVF
ncbi:hypothetical protein P4S72_14775 [Vibrio sp. PP-XX7]